MKIKKASDKPMIIHQKQKAELHICHNKEMKPKGTIKHVNRSPKIKSATLNVRDSSDMRLGKNIQKYRMVSTKARIEKRKNTHKARTSENDFTNAKKKLKIKDSKLKTASLMGANKALNHVDGGDEVRDAAFTAYVTTKPISGAASKGAKLFKEQELARKAKRIKKVDSGKKLNKLEVSQSANYRLKEVAKNKKKYSELAVAKKKAKTKDVYHKDYKVNGNKKYSVSFRKKSDSKKSGKSGKMKFFIDKIVSHNQEKTGPLNAIKSIVANTMSAKLKSAMALAGAGLLLLTVLTSITVLPIVGLVETLYSSPFAFFLPPLENGETVTTVASAYMADFNREINTLANNHEGYDSGKIVYVNYEGVSAGNFNDIVTIYMVLYGTGDTATIMSEGAKNNLKTVFDAMCSYSTSSGTETITKDDGAVVTENVLYVNVSLKKYEEMMTYYAFTDDQIQMAREMMQMFGSASGITPQSSMTQEQIDEIVKKITDSKQKEAVTFALTKVGYPYSQDYRDTGDYYDCSSLAYYSWKNAGVDISYNGANTAAAEAEGLDAAGRVVNYEYLQPGDLIFYSYEYNGRYKNISHVAIYVGDGYVVEAKGTDYGVTYNPVPSVGKIVMIGRP